MADCPCTPIALISCHCGVGVPAWSQCWREHTRSTTKTRCRTCADSQLITMPHAKMFLRASRQRIALLDKKVMAEMEQPSCLM